MELPGCHETTARAARLERGFPVTLVRLVSNVRSSREFRLGILEDFATLPQMKGQTGCVLDEACWQVREDQGLSPNRDNAAQTTLREVAEEKGVVLVRRS